MLRGPCREAGSPCGSGQWGTVWNEAMWNEAVRTSLGVGSEPWRTSMFLRRWHVVKVLLLFDGRQLSRALAPLSYNSTPLDPIGDLSAEAVSAPQVIIGRDVMPSLFRGNGMRQKRCQMA